MNNSKKTKWWQTMLALMISGLLIVGVWFLIKTVFDVFIGLQKEVAAALIAASATILVSVFSVMAAKYYERKRVIEQELRDRKIPIYEEFVSFLFKILMNEKIGKKQMSTQEMTKFFVEFTQKLMIWGSDEVVTEWSKYRKSFINNQLETKVMMFQIEKLLLAIRKDTGNKNKNFKKGDVLALFINDVEKYL